MCNTRNLIMERIVDIDFTNDAHKSIIYDLSLRNKFWIEDIYIHLYRNIIPSYKSFLLNIGVSQQEINDISKRVVKKISDYEMNGYLCIGKNKKNNDGVFGFLIYNKIMVVNSGVNINVFNLDFFLIDKNYRYRGCGDNLIKEFLNYINNIKEISLVQVKIESNELQSFYEKHGFIKSSLFKSYLSSLNIPRIDFDYYFYIPDFTKTSNNLEFLQNLL